VSELQGAAECLRVRGQRDLYHFALWPAKCEKRSRCQWEYRPIG